MKKLKPIIFFGSDEFSAITLAHLIKTGWEIPLVVSSPRRNRGRGNKDTTHPILDLADKYKLNTLTPNTFDQVTVKTLIAQNCQAAVLSSYGKILPQIVIDLFPIGIINIHPSLLPRWRGPSPIESAILAGDQETGVSIMKLDTKMDSGPIFVQAKYELTGQETQIQLYQDLAKLGNALLKKELVSIVNGTTKAQPQPNIGISFSSKLSKSDGVINWQNSAMQIERQIRAFVNWPKSQTTFLGKSVVISSARIFTESSQQRLLTIGSLAPVKNQLVVQTGSGLLEILKLKPSGKKEMDGAAFLRGYSPDEAKSLPPAEFN